METTHKSSSHVQIHAEDILFQKVAALLDINITRVPAVLVQSRGVIDAVYYDNAFFFRG